MAKVEYSFPVDKVHGKISKKHKVGFAHLNSTGRNYTVAYGQRSTKPSASELTHRAKFAAVCASARERMLDPTYINQDQLAFSKQTKYATLWGYVFRQVWDSYEGE